MKHCKENKTRKTIRDIIAGAMFALFLVSIATLDSDSWIPFVTAFGSCVYLTHEAKARGMCYGCKR